MQLDQTTMQRFQEGRFDDFLDDGASQLQRTFPRRFEGISDPDAAQDAGRNLVGKSYEFACALGRRSALLSMRIAFLRAAFGFGMVTDPRFSKVHVLVHAQVSAASIKPNTSIGTYLADRKPNWDVAPFSRGAEARRDLLAELDPNADNWPYVLAHLEQSYKAAGWDITQSQIKLFVNEAWYAAKNCGLTTPEAYRLHILASDALGHQFFEDPLLPEWQAIYATGDENRILRALRDACSGASS